MKKTIISVLICVFTALFILNSCMAPAARKRNGVFEGDFINGASIRVISGSPHNEGWFCQAQIVHADGTIQKILMEWGEGYFDMYEWRDIIDYDRMNLLYSGKYRFSSDQKVKLRLETGEAFTLTKTEEDPQDFVFDANAPNPGDGKRIISDCYTHEQIRTLQTAISTGQYTYSEFQQNFVVEVVIDTLQEQYGYCVLLLGENQESVFVFVSYEMVLTDTMVVDRFLTKEEFEAAIGSQTTKSQVLSSDPNAMDLSSADETITAHIVQEGVFVVTYASNEGEPLVDSVLFVENRETYNHGNPVVRDMIPRIAEGLKKDS